MTIVFACAGPPERKIVLTELPALIGRDPCAEICVDDSWVGHIQCIVEQEGGKLLVMDLGSRTGTFVNGARIQRALLMPGDTLTVGRTDFVVQYDQPAGWHKAKGGPSETIHFGPASAPSWNGG